MTCSRPGPIAMPADRQTLALLLLLCSVGAARSLDLMLSDNVNFNTKVGNLASQDPSLPTPPESGFLAATLTPDSSQLEGYFAIDKQTTVSATRDIDRDELCVLVSCCDSLECRLDYTAAITVRPGFTQTKALRLILRDENDQWPSFPSVEPIDISEDASVGRTSIRLASATDKDAPQHGVKNYSMTDSSGTFDVYTGDGMVPFLRLLAPLDRELVPQYQVTLRATDGPHDSSVVVTIRVTDVNDNSPAFDRALMTPSIPENKPAGEKIATLTATDRDSGRNANLTFSIPAVTPAALASYFRVDSDGGFWGLYLAKSLDFEQPDQRTADVLIEAKDQGDPPRSSTGTVRVTVTDFNDNAPVIKELASYNLEEHKPAGVLVKTLQVTDADRMSIGQVSCKIDSNPRFRLQQSSESGPAESAEQLTYSMFTTSSFDYEVSQEERVTVTCLDSAWPEKFASQTYVIPIRETNDFAPTFDQRYYFAAVSEDLAEGRSVITVKAVDKDKGTFGEVLYELDADGQRNFSIGQISGILEVRGRLDRETSKNLRFRVVAKNIGGPVPLNDSATVVIELLDVNDNWPQYLGPRELSVVENSPPGTQIGLVEFRDEDSDENGTVRFAMRGSGDNIANEYLRLDSNGTLSVAKSIDREVHSKFFVEVEAWDLGSRVRRTSTTTIQIDVRDVNDCAPVIREPRPSALLGVSAIVYTNVPRKSMVVAVQAEDKDLGDNGTIQYRLGPSNASSLLGIDAEKGEIHSIWDPDLSPPMPGIYSVTVLVSDKGRPEPLTGHVTFYLKLTAPHSPMYRFGSAGLSGLIILVVIIAGTVIIAVGLIVAICYVRGRSGLSAFGTDPADSEARVKMTEEDAFPGFRDSPRVFGAQQQQQQMLMQQQQQQQHHQQLQQHQQHQQQFYTWQRSGSPMGSLLKEDANQVYRPVMYTVQDRAVDYVPMEPVHVTRSNHTFGRGGFNAGGTLPTASPRPPHLPPPSLSCSQHRCPDSAALSGGAGHHHRERRNSEDASVDDSGRGGSVEDMKGGGCGGCLMGTFVPAAGGASSASSVAGAAAAAAAAAAARSSHLQHASTLLVRPDPSSAGTMI